MAIETKRSPVHHVFICKKKNGVHLVKKDIIYTVKDFPATISMLNTTERQTVNCLVLPLTTESYARSNRTWKTFIHTNILFFSKFVCSVFVSLRSS